MQVYMYKRMYMYKYKCMHMSVYMPTQIYKYDYIYVYVCMRIYIRTNEHKRTHKQRPLVDMRRRPAMRTSDRLVRFAATLSDALCIAPINSHASSSARSSRGAAIRSESCLLRRPRARWRGGKHKVAKGSITASAKAGHPHMKGAEEV